MKFKFKTFLLAGGALATLGASPFASSQAAFPDKAISMVAPLPPPKSRAQRPMRTLFLFTTWACPPRLRCTKN